VDTIWILAHLASDSMASHVLPFLPVALLMVRGVVVVVVYAIVLLILCK
jgi:hypothetical protein